MAYPPQLLAHRSLLGAEQTTTTGDGVSCSDHPYLLYHLSTACWIAAAFFFFYRMRHSKPSPHPQPNPLPLPIFPLVFSGSSAKYVVISVPQEMETFERGR